MWEQLSLHIFSRAVLIDRLASGKMQSEALTRPYKRLYFDNVSSNQQIADMFSSVNLP